MDAKLQKLYEIVNSDKIEQLAHQEKFVQRKGGKLNGKSFLGLLLYTCLTEINSSLSIMTSYLKSKYDISITKEGLNKRFSQYSIDFIFALLSLLMQMKDEKEQCLLDSISGWCKGVYLSDSTGFKLPNCLAPNYPGNGGSGDGVKAQAKLYYEYDLFTHRPVAYKISNGKTSDTSLMKTNGFVDKVLYMFDLAFNTKERLRAIAKQGAYFLTRQKRNAAVWIADAQLHQELLAKRYKEKPYNTDQGVYLEDLIKHFKIAKEGTKVIAVYLQPPKTKDRVLFYVHITKLPAAAKKSKELQLKKRYQKTGKPKSAEIAQLDRLMCAYNAYITNVDENYIAGGQAHKLYALRWQIELVFKSWKTHFRIDETKKCSSERFETMLGAFLVTAWILGVLCQQADTIIKQTARQQQKKRQQNDLQPPSISYFKACGLVISYWGKLIRKLFINKRKKLKKIYNKIIDNLAQNARKEYKNVKKNP